MRTTSTYRRRPHVHSLMVESSVESRVRRATALSCTVGAMWEVAINPVEHPERGGALYRSPGSTHVLLPQQVPM